MIGVGVHPLDSHRQFVAEAPHLVSPAAVDGLQWQFSQIRMLISQQVSDQRLSDIDRGHGGDPR